MADAELTSEQEALLREMRAKWDASEAVHKKLRDQWNRLDALYHSRRDFLASHAAASQRDRDGIVNDARRQFGADLLIPYAFSVVETVLPRLLSNRPRMLFTPRNEQSARNVENVRIIMDAQQHKANYELKLQTTGRSGLIYGLGVQNIAWRLEERERKRQVPRTYGDTDGQGAYAEETYVCRDWDDPDASDVSIYDFLWDPYGSCMDTVGYVFHRTWRSTSYVRHRIQSGAWGDVQLSEEDLEDPAGKQKYIELWKPRWNAQGKRVDLKEAVHEVWQYHDGRQVITVVDRKWPVATAENPAWHGRMPFAIYRPTEVLHEFCGKGEIEPVEDLSHEMNALRGDRRWNALMKMNPPTFVDDGVIDPYDVKVGPGTVNPVNAGGLPLSSLIYTQPVGDIPNSGFQEELALQADIERVSGISDPVSGGSGAEQTATGVQLLQAAAGVRIQNKTRRIELELIRPSAEMWLALNQQRITEARDIAIPMSPELGGADKRWAWLRIGPEQLAGEFDVEPDGGSTAPENVPQMRQDAQLLLNMMQVPGLEPRKVLVLALEKMGVKAPEQLLAPEVQVPPATLDLIAQMLVEQVGVPPEVAQQVIEQSLNTALNAQNPTAQDGAPEERPVEPEQPPEEMAA